MTVYVEEFGQLPASFSCEDEQALALPATGASFHAESLVYHPVASEEDKKELSQVFSKISI